jgi:dimethylhistidine N-methyltransferase
MTPVSALASLPAISSHAGVSSDIESEVLRGLLASPKSLPPKLFYDAYGAELFERITALPEYYLTRAEFEILEERASEIARLAGAACTLVEYGSGAGRKVGLLLDAMQDPSTYVPIDICAEQLAAVAGEIAAAYPKLAVWPIAADYTLPLVLPTITASGRRMAFFPGSTIGNLTPDEATEFLSHVRRTVGPNGALLLGVDRVKSSCVLNAAYNDARGVTAAFNINVLRRLNRELGADFRLDGFSHLAFFNEAAMRVEMHLVSAVAQTVSVGGARVHFRSGETIWTESSYKYDQTRLKSLATAAGFTVKRLWTDAASRFWVAFLEVERPSGRRLPNDS